MARQFYLGLDIGTSGVKAVLIGQGHEVEAESYAPLAIMRPQPLWSEQHAEDYWQASKAALAELQQAAPDAYRLTSAIGLSGQMHGAVTLDKADQPIRPVILWNDGRCTSEADALGQADAVLTEAMGVWPMPGFTAPKLLWLRQHEPQSFARINCLMLPKDYVRLKLTGTRVTDMSDAAGTWLFDQQRRDWSDSALELAGLARAQMPVLVEGSDVSGILRADVAKLLGLPAGTPVAGGGGDAAAGGVGIGAINHHDRFISLGTSAQYFLSTAAFRPNIARLVHAFAHAVPERWYQMGCMLNGASVFGFAASLVGREVGALSAAIAASYQGPSPLLMLPYLTGERTPHNDAAAKGVLFGLTPDSDAVSVGQAAMEGVAFALADQAQALGDTADDAPVALIGGGARSAIWAQIIANVLARPVLRYHGADKGPAFGAALLAEMAATGARPQDVAKAPPLLDRFEPDTALYQAYQPRLAAFRALYGALKMQF